MKIGICNDHRGVNKKNKVIALLKNHEIINYGTDSVESVDFPDYAYKLGKALQNKEIDLGIAICGTGIGMSICLNKMNGIYCAKVSKASEAILCKSHNNANCMAISEEMSDDILEEVLNNFINTPFSNVNKYVKRNDKIKGIENNG